MPSPEMLTSLLGRTANVRRIRRWRGLAAAAAVALVAVAGGAAVTNALEPNGSQTTTSANVPAWQQTSGTGPQGAHLTVRYRHKTWGTEMQVNVTGLRPGSVCQFQVTNKAGGKSVVGSWVLWQGSDWYPASTALGESHLSAFQVTIHGHVVASAPAT
jgi:hypothetical protein